MPTNCVAPSGKNLWHIKILTLKKPGIDHLATLLLYGLGIVYNTFLLILTSYWANYSVQPACSFHTQKSHSLFLFWEKGRHWGLKNMNKVPIISRKISPSGFKKHFNFWEYEKRNTLLCTIFLSHTFGGWDYLDNQTCWLIKLSHQTYLYTKYVMEYL